MKKRALVSLFKKQNLQELGTILTKHGFEIISTGGTARELQNLGFKVLEVAEVTGSAEYPEGLVKTLHPKIHFALLADRDNAEHVARLEADGIVPIDLVICNLYAFSDVARREDVADDELRHLIDIGGPTMIRAGAKNFKHVTVIVDPADYAALDEHLAAGQGKTSLEFRKRMAAKAFSHTADYDALIDTTLSKRFGTENGEGVLQYAPTMRLKFVEGKELRYGENPHQSAKVFVEQDYQGPNLTKARQIWGKEMSYNNFVDADGALEAVLGFETCTVAVVKHTNPCGLATGVTPRAALARAWEGDIVSAFGSVIACNREVDAEFMDFLDKRFVEIVLAPSFAADVTAWLETHQKKNLRVLEVGSLAYTKPRTVYKYIHGGMLVQQEDEAVVEKWESVTQIPYPGAMQGLGMFAYQAVKYIKSNEISICREYAPGQYELLAMGAGQPNRVDSIRKLAFPKAKENLEREYNDVIARESSTAAISLPKTNREIATSPRQNEVPRNDSLQQYVAAELAECVLASGAFFPFRDSIEVLHEGGIKFVVEPGGSVRDDEVIKACDECGIAMVFTGMRHFRH